MNELKNRGVEDVLIAVVDGLKGFPDAITAVLPQTLVQTCIVHLIRNSLDFVSYKDRKAVVAALKQIYRAKDAAGEACRLDLLSSPPVTGQSERTQGARHRVHFQRLWARGGSVNSKTLQSAVENVKVFIVPLVVSNLRSLNSKKASPRFRREGPCRSRPRLTVFRPQVD